MTNFRVTFVDVPLHDVRQVMPEDGIVCLDNGMYEIWFARNYRTHVANTLLLDNALATMGAGLPAAIAVVILHPRRRVLAVCGDGGFMMSPFKGPRVRSVRKRSAQATSSAPHRRSTTFSNSACFRTMPICVQIFGKRRRSPSP